MNFLIIFGLIAILTVVSFSSNVAVAQLDSISEIKFFQTGELNTLENKFQISNQVDIRESSNGNIIRISGLTIEGFPYITYSKILEEEVNTRGIIFIQGEFKKLTFDEEIIVEQENVEKNDNMSLLVKYTQRAYSEKTIYVDVKTFDKDQNKLNDFNQNYGHFSNVNIDLKLTNEDNTVVFSSNGTTNENGLFETQYLIPENSKRETLILTINAENEKSATSKIFQVFSLGQIPDNGSPPTP